MFDDGDTVYDYEAQQKIRVCDEIPAVRRAFAAKVLGQTAALLALVAVICAAGMASSDETQDYLLGRGLWIFYLAVAVSFAIVLSNVNPWSHHTSNSLFDSPVSMHSSAAVL